MAVRASTGFVNAHGRLSAMVSDIRFDRFLRPIAVSGLIAAAVVACTPFGAAEPDAPPVDKSRSAKVYASFQDKITAAVPENVPTWIIGRYNDLTKICVPAAGATVAPAATVAPSN